MGNSNICPHNFVGSIGDGHDGHVLKLRVLHTPVGQSEGSALVGGFNVSDTVELFDLSSGKEVEVLTWRYSEALRNARPSNGSRPAMSKEDVDLPPWPAQRCFSMHHRFWKVSLPSKPGCFGILQMTSNPTERSLESLEQDTEASATLAAYASKFNTQQASEHANDAPPAIKVVAPLGCQIIDSNFSSMFAVNDAVVLYVLPCVKNVEKFLFNGADKYVDVPQSFFHFVALASGGRELAYDLQGIQDSAGDIFLVDPAILNVRGKKGASEVPMCGQLIGGGSEALEWSHFQALHPRCSPLCKVFDPHRAVRLGRGLTCCN